MRGTPRIGSACASCGRVLLQPLPSNQAPSSSTFQGCGSCPFFIGILEALTGECLPKVGIWTSEEGPPKWRHPHHHPIGLWEMRP